ncbi:membrane protein [Gemmobacter aquaticus]|jgi:uncharacterized membrane protein|uniref:Membrane protein n=1 Tax=Gemmobacter aquaticus TaxID=490185 RepID=A0A918DCI0_9RHOB|nr:DUF599 domain-containing protein [Gemmobacter aquaticus]GGO32034.1 membrane protein [Gemmobacter aquaticus]
MDAISILRLFTPADALAVGFSLTGAIVLQRLIESPTFRRPSVSQIMVHYRRDWMREMVTRQPRIFDATILDGLRQGITFYASSCLIGLGAGLALVSDTTPLQGLATSFDLDAGPALIMKAKILFVLAFVVNAFLMFVWSHRLFGYCSVLLASVPNDIHHPRAYERAARAAEVNITAARNYNRGLRSVYYALGALGWLLGPWALIVTMGATFATLIRREFASQSREAIIARLTEDAPPPRH